MRAVRLVATTVTASTLIVGGLILTRAGTLAVVGLGVATMLVGAAYAGFGIMPEVTTDSLQPVDLPTVLNEDGSQEPSWTDA